MNTSKPAVSARYAVFVFVFFIFIWLIMQFLCLKAPCVILPCLSRHPPWTFRVFCLGFLIFFVFLSFVPSCFVVNHVRELLRTDTLDFSFKKETKLEPKLWRQVHFKSFLLFKNLVHHYHYHHHSSFWYPWEKGREINSLHRSLSCATLEAPTPAVLCPLCVSRSLSVALSFSSSLVPNWKRCVGFHPTPFPTHDQTTAFKNLVKII